MTDLSTKSATRLKVEELATENAAIIKRIAKFGLEVTGTETHRLNYLIRWMYDNVLTEAQREDFELAYQTEMNDTLKEQEGKARDMVVAAQAEQSKLAGQQLGRRGLIKPPTGLVVPGRPG